MDAIKPDKQPLITIGIASYNYARYLKRAFEAIRRQKFKDYEILYSDDGSTDESVTVIEQFIRENPDIKIRLIKGTNIGVMGNKNRILKEAQGKYLMLCDADDWMSDDCLEILSNEALTTNADQIAAAFQNVTDNQILQIQDIPENQSKWTWGIHHATLYKMDIIRKYDLSFKTNAYPDDVYFNMIFHAKSGKTHFINKVVYNWYTHEQSTSSRANNDDLWHGVGLLNSSLEYILPILNKANEKDKPEIEYMACKMYGLAIFFRNTKIPFAKFYEGYLQIHKVMEDKLPEYKNNVFCNKINGGKILRKRTANIIYITVICEKLKIMKLALFTYWVLSKIHTFAI